MNLYVTGFSLAEGDGSHEITVVPANTVEVKIFDTQGRYVASQRDAAPLSADALPRGIVMVTVVTADGAVSSAKFAL